MTKQTHKTAIQVGIVVLMLIGSSAALAGGTEVLHQPNGAAIHFLAACDHGDFGLAAMQSTTASNESQHT